MTNTDLYIDVDDGSFMKGAVEQVIQCRIVLKYSYVLGYYLCSDISNYDPTNSTIPLEKLESAKYLFEHQQELLEKNNELLSELTEDYCNNIYSSITVVASSASKSVATSKPIAAATTAGVKPTSAVGSTATTPDKKISNDELSGTPQTISEKRNRIINLTRITEKFMSHLLQSIGTDGNASKILELGEMDGVAGGMKGGIAGGSRGGRKDRMMVEGVEYDSYAYEDEDEEEGDYEDEHIQQAIIESTRAGGGGVSGVSGSSSSHATRGAVAAAGVSGSGSSGGIMSALWNTLTHPTSSATTAATTPAIAVPVATAVPAPAPTTTTTATTTTAATAAVTSPKSNSIRSKRTSSGNNK